MIDLIYMFGQMSSEKYNIFILTYKDINNNIDSLKLRLDYINFIEIVDDYLFIEQGYNNIMIHDNGIIDINGDDYSFIDIKYIKSIIYSLEIPNENDIIRIKYNDEEHGIKYLYFTDISEISFTSIFNEEIFTFWSYGNKIALKENIISGEIIGEITYTRENIKEEYKILDIIIIQQKEEEF